MTSDNETAPEKTSDPAEDAVRRYLVYLTEPSALIDERLIEALKKRLLEETDVLGRLKIVATIESLEKLDDAALRKDFVRHARTYAQRENIPSEAFAAMGVSADVLADAGLGSSRTKATSAGARTSGTRTRVGRQQIVDVVPDGFFTIRELEERSGANSLTVRRVIEDLVTSGQLAEFEPDPNYPGRGRAPKRYKKI